MKHVVKISQIFGLFQVIKADILNWLDNIYKSRIYNKKKKILKQIVNILANLKGLLAPYNYFTSTVLIIR